MKLTILTVLTALTLLKTAAAQRLLVPAYDLSTARLALETAHDRGRGITLIFNPCDGPGAKKDKGWRALAKAARQYKTPMLGYVDLVDWSDKKGPRIKTAGELLAEAKRYGEFYGSLQGWFLDDLWPEMIGTEALKEPTTWKGEIVGNPGRCLPKWPQGFDVIITHEGPMYLQQGPKAHENTGALALATSDRELEQAWDKAKGSRYFFAHDQEDRWKEGQSCFQRLPAYWQTLLRIVK